MDLLHYSTSSEEELEEETENEVHGAINQGGTPKRGKVTVSSDKVSGIRQQRHVIGNWAGLCFLPVRDAIDSLQVDRLLSKLCNSLEDVGYSGHCQVHDEHHVSLSRPFYLHEANLQPFVQTLSVQLSMESTLLGPFDLTVDQSDSVILTNDDSTRSFLACRAHANELEQITNICNRILRNYQQPAFYDDNQFHVSLASFIPALDPNTIRLIDDSLLLLDQGNEGCKSLRMTHICIKFGTVQLFEIPLTVVRDSSLTTMVIS
jgi:Uncharacterised conserved protein